MGVGGGAPRRELSPARLARLPCPGSCACPIWVARSTLQAWGSLEQGQDIP